MTLLFLFVQTFRLQHQRINILHCRLQLAGACKTELAQNYEMSICQAGLANKTNAMFSQFNLTGHGVFLYLVGT